MRKKVEYGDPIELPDGWKSGLKTCGLGVAVHEDYGYVANIYNGEFITPYFNRGTGTMMIKVPVNMGSNAWINSSRMLPLGRVVRLVCDDGKPPQEFIDLGRELWVYHRNGNKRDNTPDNLTWATPRMALQDALEMGKLNTKLNAEQVRSIRQIAEAMMGSEEGLNCEALGKAFGVAAGYVKQLLRTIQDPEGGNNPVWKHWNFVGMPDTDWEPPEPVVDQVKGECKKVHEFEFMQFVMNDGKTVYDY